MAYRVIRTAVFRLFTSGVFALLCASLISCGKENNRAFDSTAPVKVKTYQIEVKKERALEWVPGTVRPARRATIEAKVSGIVEKVHVSEGQAVKEGQPLIELNVKELKAKLDQALAVHDEAQTELQRFAVLLRQKATTQSEFDSVDAKAKIAAANVAEAQTMLGYAKVTAPFNAVITRKNTNVGDLAAPGRALLELEDPSVLRLEAGVPEGLIAGIKTGEIYAVALPSLAQTLDGVVTEIAPVADSNSRTYLVKLMLPPIEAIRGGQFGRAAIRGPEESTLKVPLAAVIKRGQLEYVYIIKQGRAWLRLVRSGRRFGDMVELLAGVTEGEKVAQERAESLRDGQTVEVL